MTPTQYALAGLAVAVALAVGYVIGRAQADLQRELQIIDDITDQVSDILASKREYKSPADEAAQTTTDTADTAGS